MARKINLRDPDFEPTDEELAELMNSAFSEIRKNRKEVTPETGEEMVARKMREREVAQEIWRRIQNRMVADAGKD
jgi:hypothetical protein